MTDQNISKTHMTSLKVCTQNPTNKITTDKHNSFLVHIKVDNRFSYETQLLKSTKCIHKMRPTTATLV